VTSAAATFDQIERSADRTLAIVLWAKHAKNIAAAALGVAIITQFVHSLVKSLSTDKLNTLSREQAIELTKKLQTLHANLTRLLNVSSAARLSNKTLFQSSLQNLDDYTEDLGDIIENLVLSENEEFRSFVSDCVQGLSSAHSVGARERM
jgi:hypothetical protein